MGFFAGRATFSRYRVDAQAPQMFTQEHLDRLAENAAGRQRMIAADGVEVGWAGGEHIFDVSFDFAKNVINDMLVFSMRIDSVRLPADLLAAYYAIDLAALSKDNPSGRPSTRQKREAKESARDRLEDEAKDGRFTKRKAIEVVWDRLSNEVWFGTTSATHADRMALLFKQTFGANLEPIDAGKRAYSLAELHNRTRNVDDATPSLFVPHLLITDVVWVVDDASRKYLGNEFMLWLWHQYDDGSDPIELADGSLATVWIARTLKLECPRGMTGQEAITFEGPTRLPEAMRAIQSGKLPRKCGLTIVRRDVPYEFTLNAETLAVSGCKLQPPEDEGERARLESRAQQLRDAIETIDLLYDAFGRVRFSDEWPKTLVAMQKWLSQE